MYQLYSLVNKHFSGLIKIVLSWILDFVIIASLVILPFVIIGASKTVTMIFAFLALFMLKSPLFSSILFVVDTWAFILAILTPDFHFSTTMIVIYSIFYIPLIVFNIAIILLNIKTKQ